MKDPFEQVDLIEDITSRLVHNNHMERKYAEEIARKWSGVSS